MDSTTTAATDPQSQQRQQPHNQQPKQQSQQQQPPSQLQQQQPSSQHPQSKHQPQARPNQNQNQNQQHQQLIQQPHQQPQQQIQQHQPQQQHPQHVHQGQPPQAYAPPTMPQYSNYSYAGYAPQPYPTPYPPYAPYSYQPTPWTPRPSANFTSVQSQPQYAPNMVNPQTQPNVPHNRPSSATIHAGQYIDRTHNQGLQQVTVMNPPLISTAKPLASRPKQMATLKTPDGKEIKLPAKDSSTTKNPSTTITAPSTKPTQTTNTTTTAEHGLTLLQKVSEVASVDSKTIGAEVRRAEEESNDKANDKKSVDQKVGVKKAEERKVDDKKSEESNKVEKKTVEVNKSEDNIKPAADNCTIADKRVNVEAVDDKKKKDVTKESTAATDDDKENQIHVQDKTTTIVDQQADSTKEVEAVKTSIEEVDNGKNVKEAESERKEDTSSKTEEKDESSNTLTYEAGQYDPVNNRSGKKKYSREFLMEVRKRLEEDEGLKNFGPVIDRSDPFDVSLRFGLASGRNSASRQDDSTRRQGQNNYSGRSSAGQEVKRIVITSASLNQDVELNTSANPWRPQKDVAKEEQPQDVLDTEALKKKFRSILNKLTPNNFDSLAQSVTKLPIDSESKLGDVIDIVFAKALAEPGYCVLYGQMCSHLKKNTTEGTNFSNTLLKRCQNQFQSDIYAGLTVDERREKIEDEKDSEVKKQLEEELYEDMYRCRMRGLGLIKFIGELYKIEMLNDAIMYDCVLRLLNDQSEEALECLCDLLVTIGEKLDLSTSKRIANQEKERLRPKGAKANAYQGGPKLASIIAGQQQQKTDLPSLDKVFDELQKIRKNNDLPLSKRIRFKLLDTIELREKDKWQSKRTKDNNPKKIDEIRKAHEEKLEQEKRQNMAMGPRRSQEHRRLGPSGGSSNQISSLANESGGRGLHTSASSHLLRDHPSGDMRNNHNVDAERRDYQRNLGLFKNLTRGTAPTTLRPMTSLNKPRAE